MELGRAGGTGCIISFTKGGYQHRYKKVRVDKKTTDEM